LKQELEKAKKEEAAADKAAAEAKAELDEALDKDMKTPKDSPDKAATEKAVVGALGKYLGALEVQKQEELDRKQIEEDIAHPEQLYTPPLVASPAPGARTKCEEAADFLDQCNSQNWRGAECERFLAGISKCADPSLVRTDGEGAACGLPAVSPEATEHALLVACDAGRRRPVPGEDPCKVVIDGVAVSRFYGPNGFLRPSAPGCGDPNSRVDPETCITTFRVIEFGVPDLQKIAEYGRQKLGGPLVLITVKNPDPTPRPGPGPRPGPRP
jgi:hypothetical protein